MFTRALLTDAFREIRKSPARFASIFAIVAIGVGGVALLEWIATMLHPLALFVVHVAVLYLTVGFRQFSHAFTEIQIALASDDAEGARRVLERWLSQADPDDLSDRPRRETPVNEICRQAIAHALVAAHAGQSRQQALSRDAEAGENPAGRSTLPLARRRQDQMLNGNVFIL